MRISSFRLVSLLILVIPFSFVGCATVFDVAGDDDGVGYDRGFNAKQEGCTGRLCDGGPVGDEDDEDADTDFGSIAKKRAPASVPSFEAKRAQKAIHSRDIILGMTRRQVLDSWGEPSVREVAGDGKGGHERWTYGSRYTLHGSRIVIFEDGHVAGWNR